MIFITILICDFFLFANTFNEYGDLKISVFRENHVNFMIKVPLHMVDSMECDTTYAVMQVKNKKETFQMLCIEEIYRVDVIMDHYFSPDIYQESVNFKFLIERRSKSNAAKSTTLVHDGPLSIISNGYYTISYTDGLNEVEINIIYRCIGYTGSNCHKEIPPEELPNIRPQRPICNEPEDCDDKPCSDNSFCSNNGNCFIHLLQPRIKYCVCNTGYVGLNCQVPLPMLKLSEDMLLFQPLSSFEALKEKSPDCQGCPDSACEIYKNFKVCTKKDDQLLECTGECYEVCGPDVCLKAVSDDINIYYLKSLKEN